MDKRTIKLLIPLLMYFVFSISVMDYDFTNWNIWLRGFLALSFAGAIYGYLKSISK